MAAPDAAAVDEQQRKAAEQLEALSQVVLKELGSKWFGSFVFPLHCCCLS